MMTAADVLGAIRVHDAIMGHLGAGDCAIEHVSLRDPNGPDTRLDSCPCDRGPETLPVDGNGQPVVQELGGGQYISSARHTLADVVRDLGA